MDDPPKHPGDVACFYPDIAKLENHRGAGPANHMFYLLAYGGVSRCNQRPVAGVGLDVAGKIYWRAFNNLSAAATYATLRDEFLRAANHFYPGPNEIVLSTAAASTPST